MKILKINLMLILLLIVTGGNTAIITVTANHGLIDNADSVCSISEAIINANDDTQTHVDCTAGNGVDTINLIQNITLTTEIESSPIFGRTGTPAVTSSIILDGKNFSIQRDNGLLCNINNVDEL